MNQKVIVLTATLLLSLAACAPKADRAPASIETVSSDGIIAGAEVVEGDDVSKSIVAILNLESGGLCTGSLLPSNIVVTAAHCIPKTNARLIVVFGNSTRPIGDKKPVAYPIDVATVSQYYNASNKTRLKDQGDIALVHFLGTAPAGYKPARVLRDQTLLQNGVTVLLAGYGRAIAKPEEGKSSGSGLLRSTTVTVSDAKFAGTEIKLDQTQGTGACHGDSGGPAYVEQNGQLLLWGVTSRGVEDANDDCSKYAVYTNILPYVSWINESARKLLATSASRSATKAATTGAGSGNSGSVSHATQAN